MKNPIHHIIPRYKCEELGINSNFPENLVEVAREDHALIHWGYKCDDLEPLFKYVRPEQWIIDLIPREDNRDAAAAVLTARGEIDGIDISGENHPMWGKSPSLETRKKMSNSNIWRGKKRPEHSKKIKELQSHGGFRTGIPHTEETKKQISNSTSGEKNGHFGKNHTPEAKEKIRQARLGTTASDETRKKLSKMRKGKGTGQSNSMSRTNRERRAREKAES